MLSVEVTLISSLYPGQKKPRNYPAFNPQFFDYITYSSLIISLSLNSFNEVSMISLRRISGILLNWRLGDAYETSEGCCIL